MRVFVCVLLGLVVGCGEDELERREVPEGATIIAVGDSVFDYYFEEGASIPQVIGEELGEVVYNAAVSGAMFTEGEAAIPGQYVEGDWEWLVVIGGANDANDLCGCEDCDEVIEAIVDADATGGLLVDLVDEATGQGARVILVGYYDVPSTADFGFAACNDTIDAYKERQWLLADAQDDVWLVDAAELFGPGDLEMYHEDHAHPSPKGSRAIGEAIAARIAAIETGS